MHYSRIMPVIQGARYFTSTAVLLNEIIKLVICVAVVIYDKSREGKPWSLVGLWNEIFGGDAWKLTIPAALYTVAPNCDITNSSFKIICSTLQYQISMQQPSK